MNTSQIIAKSRELFTQFKQLNDSLYKGNYQVNNKVAGIYYLNFGNDITEEYFDDIQYKYLADEFYKNEDSLQWNIYLLFINSNISDELKLKILNNDKYARKLIFQESDFVDYFNLEKPNHTSLPDLVSEWKHELREVDLQEVCSNIPYNKAIQNFIDNNTTKEDFETTVTDTSDTLKVNKINSVELTGKFRKYPLIREFVFGSVNLINGANGTGKTSLLESIELLLAGKSFRNSETLEEENSIKGIFNGTIQDSYSPNNIGKYKARDIKWYNRNQLAKGNSCHIAFNQFNFFNTDAAYQFASTEHEEQLNESLKQIILGSEYAFLRDRIQGFEKWLKPELKATDKKISEQRELVEKYTKLIEDLKSNGNILELKQNIANNILALQYRQKFDETDFSVSHLRINEIKTELSYILSQNLVLNFSNLGKLKSQTNEDLLTVSTLRNKYSERLSQIIDLIDSKKSIEIISNKLKKALKYFIVKDIRNIENFEKLYQEYNSYLLRLPKIKQKISVISSDKLLKEDQRFTDFKTSKTEDFQRLSAEIKRLESEIRVLNENFSIIEDILNKIKLLGKDFLSHQQHSENCPLCEQKISHTDLSKKLENDFERNLDKSILNDKSQKLSALKATGADLTSQLNALNDLKGIAQDEFPDYETLTITEIISRLTFILGEEQDVLEKKEEIETAFVQIKSIDGSISEFKSLKEEIKTQLELDESFEKTDLEKALLGFNEEYKKVNKSIEELEKENRKLISELNKRFGISEVVNDISKILNDIISKNETIKGLEDSFNKIKGYIELPENKSLIDLDKEIKLLDENIKSLKDSENKQNELKRIIKELEEAKSFITKNATTYDRLKKAVALLQKLNSNRGESVLEDYFRANLNEIKDIFKTIHAPQEFTDLKFEKKKLVLYKNGSKHSVTQISTGQRAALVVSIFISLNRKLKNGPNILIFDDPVAFIDDFNALSFLDFLRYFIVKENKQIFFATANRKFSAVFRKKFEFLQDDYKEFVLTR